MTLGERKPPSTLCQCFCGVPCSPGAIFGLFHLAMIS